MAKKQNKDKNFVEIESKKEQNATTIDEKEIEHFSNLAREWWDSEGKFRPLHKFNPARIQYIVAKLCQIFHKDPKAYHPLRGLSILDIGCGGGLLSEPMARLGGKVTGADAGEKNIKIAKIHAEQNDLAIEYYAKTAEQLAQEGHQFDVILNMEVVEHVQNVPLFIKSCSQMLKPNGVMFIATLNRNWKAFGLAIIGAEYILQWLPKGTHHYDKFLKPHELQQEIEKNGLKLIDQTGVVYNPLKDSWNLSRDMSVNYILLTQHPA